jgi:hypothetical protein
MQIMTICIDCHPSEGHPTVGGRESLFADTCSTLYLSMWRGVREGRIADGSAEMSKCGAVDSQSPGLKCHANILEDFREKLRKMWRRFSPGRLPLHTLLYSCRHSFLTNPSRVAESPLLGANLSNLLCVLISWTKSTAHPTQTIIIHGKEKLNASLLGYPQTRSRVDSGGR